MLFRRETAKAGQPAALADRTDATGFTPVTAPLVQDVDFGSPIANQNLPGSGAAGEGDRSA